MMLVQLTEIPAKDFESMIKNEILGHLTTYKTVFFEPRVIDTLMTHLADCLQREEKTTKHNQMIELIVVLFKQLLTIPDSDTGSEQKQLLLKFQDASVLDSFNFLTQDFKDPLNKKLAMHFLEIQYRIFSCFTAK